MVLNAPDSLAPELDLLRSETELWTSRPAADVQIPFILGFATLQAEVDLLAAVFQEHSSGDAVLWIAYPKASSKKYRCDFNRDRGWEVLGAAGFEPVRQVAIDQDWSALRFRRVEFIQKMSRNFAMTEVGKSKVQVTVGAVSPSADFQAALDQNPVAAAFFAQLAPSHRKAYILWIEEAKKAETQKSRIEKAVQMLAEGKKR